MIYQEAFKALIKVLNNSEEEKNVCLRVKKPVSQISSFIALILVLEADQLADSSIPLLVTPSNSVFANT